MAGGFGCSGSLVSGNKVWVHGSDLCALFGLWSFGARGFRVRVFGGEAQNFRASGLAYAHAKVEKVFKRHTLKTLR